MKKVIISILLLAMLIGGGLGYKYYRDKHDDKQFTNDDMATVVVGDIEDVVTAQGTLEPKDYVDVGAQVSGLIKKLFVDYGSNVKVGDPIAQIDDEIYATAYKSDQAALKTYSAQKLEKEANLKLAQVKFDRYQKLFKVNGVSKEEFDDAENALAVAKAQLDSVSAQIEQTQSSIDKDKTNLGYTKIYSPMAGTVVTKSVNEGQTINANQTTPVIVEVANLDVMTAKGQVAEADVMRVNPDMKVYFTTLGSEGRRWYGKVRQILPTPETSNNVVLFDVLVDVENKDRQLMNGMTTQMFFVLNTAKAVPVIPKNALLKRLSSKDTKDGQAYTVRVIKEDNSVEEREIMVGVSDRTKVSVTTGLQAGEKVLVGDAAKNYGLQSKGGFPRGMGRI